MSLKNSPLFADPKFHEKGTQETNSEDILSPYESIDEYIEILRNEAEQYGIECFFTIRSPKDSGRSDYVFPTNAFVEYLAYRSLGQRKANDELEKQLAVATTDIEKLNCSTALEIIRKQDDVVENLSSKLCKAQAETNTTSYKLKLYRRLSIFLFITVIVLVVILFSS